MNEHSQATEPLPQKRKWRLWIPLTVIIVPAIIIAWFYITENTLRAHALQILSSVAILMVALWFTFLSGQSSGAKARLSLILVAFFSIFGAGLASGYLRLEPDGSGWFSLKVGKKIILPGLEEEIAKSTDDEKKGPEGTESPGQANLNRFLGENGNGVIAGADLITDWENSPPKEIWRREIGAGWSSFAVSNGLAITMEQRGDDELTVAYDLLTGKPVWQEKNRARFEESMGGTGPRSTPTIAGDKVISLGATGILKCLDLESGNLIWEHNVLSDFNSSNVDWGKSCSPLVCDGKVIVSSGKEGPTLVAYGLENGGLMWKSDSNRPTSYASPVLATILGQEQILSVNGDSLTGHDPATGKELWSFDWEGGYPKVGQPVTVGEDKVLITASYSMGTYLVKISKEGDAWDAEEAWRTNRMKTKFSSAVVVDDHAYGLNEGRFSCVSLADGEEVWRDGRYGYGQNVLIGNTVLVQEEQGEIVLVAADPKGLKELGKVSALSGKTWTVPAVAGEFLLVRNAEEMACFKISRKETVVSESP